jgi:hypothetical protein
MISNKLINIWKQTNLIYVICLNLHGFSFQYNFKLDNNQLTTDHSLIKGNVEQRNNPSCLAISA